MSLSALERITFAMTAVLLSMGLYFGFSDDNWGWWPYPLIFLIAGLWLIKRNPKAIYGHAAKAALVVISIILGLLALGTVLFINWVGHFEF